MPQSPHPLHGDSPFDRMRAERLLVMRELAKRNYRDFLKLWIYATNQRIVWNWHLDYLCDIMQAVSLRQLKRVIINIPPRHLKSTVISQNWQAWLLGRDPGPRSSVLSCGVTSALAARDSRRTLNIIKSDWYQAIFPNTQLIRENESEWETTAGGYRIAVGVGGTVTGRGGDFCIWDDILKAEDANSEVIREATNEWLGETLATRLNDPMTGAIAGVMQRLHERDPTGYLLHQMRLPGADQYEHIVLPLEAPTKTFVEFQYQLYKVREPGELLHAERLGPTEVLALKASMRANYSGQYQQNPCKMEGGHLDPRRMTHLPGDGLAVKSTLGLVPNIYIDLASSEKQTHKDDPDYSVITVAGKDQLGRLVILDIYRIQTADQANLARTLLAMHRLWNPRWVRGEKGGPLNTFQVSLNTQMKLIGRYLTMLPLSAGKQDKVERSLPFQGMLNAGMVCVPERAPWLMDFEAEMRAFPNGAHDDMVDTVAYAALDVEAIREGEAPIVHPDDPQIQIQNEMRERIEKRANAFRNPKAQDDAIDADWGGGDWG